jgi:hypothetical protein
VLFDKKFKAEKINFPKKVVYSKAFIEKLKPFCRCLY